MAKARPRYTPKGPATKVVNLGTASKPRKERAAAPPNYKPKGPATRIVQANL